mmetsp:Transcript_17791/g.21450  ORF Transcript_17791/g.21450 Transcript_17791/m.21450 type:complete len:239 (+) Transcript_17791:1-717(+)
MAFYGLGVVNLFQQVAIEAVLLAIRCSNEIWSRRFDIDDFIHHSAMILGSALITFHDPFKPYAYLLVHSQILHVPMAVFYYRKLLTNIYFDNRGSGNCATKSKRMTSLPSPPPPPPLIARRQVMFAESGFRVFWLFCTGYRGSLLLSAALHRFLFFFSFFLISSSTTSPSPLSSLPLFYPPPSTSTITTSPIAGFIMLGFALIISSLDVWWSMYFIKKLNWKKYQSSGKYASSSSVKG